MRKGWSKLNQNDALDMTYEFLTNIPTSTIKNTKYSDSDFLEILEILADGKKFVSMPKEELAEVFKEIGLRFCQAYNLKMPKIKMVKYIKNSALYGYQFSGSVCLNCVFDKNKVLPSVYNQIGFRYLAYFYHELRHYYQRVKAKEFLLDNSIKNKIDIDACIRVDYIEQCYNSMGETIEEFYEFNTAERDANYFAFKMVTSLARKYPKYKQSLYDGLMEICGTYLADYTSKKVDIVNDEAKMVKYYINKFKKDFITNEAKVESFWLSDFNEEKFKKLKYKQKEEVEKFMSSYVTTKFEVAMKNPEFAKFKTRLEKIMSENNPYIMFNALLLLKEYDSDMDKVEEDVKDLNFGTNSMLLKGEVFENYQVDFSKMERKINK